MDYYFIYIFLLVSTCFVDAAQISRIPFTEKDYKTYCVLLKLTDDYFKSVGITTNSKP